MKREIKFRGKRIDNGEWVYGYLVIDPTNKYRIYYQPLPETTSNTYHFVDPESIGQFTGLADKHGKEIYENDIIEFSDSFGETHRIEVLFIDGAFGGIFNEDGLYNLSYLCYYYQTEIIGNTHQHPELI